MRLRLGLTLVSTFLFCAAFLSAQDVNVPVSLQYSPQLPPVVTVINHAASSIIALTLVTQVKTGAGEWKPVIYSSSLDTGINYRHDRPIAPGERRIFPVAHPVGRDLSNLRPEIQAVLFADGTSMGDPVWVAKLRTRRVCAARELDSLDILLRRAMSQQLDIHRIQTSLDGMTSSVQSGQSDSYCKWGAQLPLLLVTRSLQHAGAPGAFNEPQKMIPHLLDVIHRWRGSLHPL